MNFPDSEEALQHLVISYLYGDLSEIDVVRFEEELQSNAILNRILEDEQRFDSAFPQISQPVISDERIQGNRWLLHQNLQKEQRSGISVKRWFADLAERPLAVAFQSGAMAMTFVLGIYVASNPVEQIEVPISAPQLVAEASPLDLINDDDFEIYQLKVNNYDSNTGEIDLSFSLASETSIRGNVADEQIHSLMAVALQDDIGIASRLDTINALQAVSSGDQVFEALIHVLANDQNPGVRYQAAQSLAGLAHEEKVRDALRYALVKDANQGVRVEAFQALVNYPEEETLQVFRRQMDSDSNEFIRSESRAVLQSLTETEESDEAFFENSDSNVI